MPTTKEQLNKKGEVMSPVKEEVTQIYSLWEQIAQNPDEWLQDMQGELAYVAGGGLPLVFGDSLSEEVEPSEIWEAIKAAAAEKQDTVEIAGIFFTLKELSLMGDFYRFIKKQGNAYIVLMSD